MTIAEPERRRTGDPAPYATQRFVLHGVTWDAYEAMVDALADQRVFLTYNQGVLELMSPSPRHEKLGLLLARLVHTYTEVARIPIVSLGMTTWKRRKLDKGLEADQCFYVQNELPLRHKERIDLAVDPPPDLAIEVDLSHGSVDKEDVYASLGVPELWRYEDGRVTVMTLQAGRYAPAKASPAFPELAVGELSRFLAMRDSVGETDLVVAFREWVEQGLNPGASPRGS